MKELREAVRQEMMSEELKISILGGGEGTEGGGEAGDDKGGTKDIYTSKVITTLWGFIVDPN